MGAKKKTKRKSTRNKATRQRVEHILEKVAETREPQGGPYDDGLNDELEVAAAYLCIDCKWCSIKGRRAMCHHVPPFVIVTLDDWCSKFEVR